MVEKIKKRYKRSMDNIQAARASMYTPRIGDVVSLNSGSPPMTVVDFEDDQVTVAWREEKRVHEMTTDSAAFNAG